MQKAKLLELYEEHKFEKRYLSIIAESLPGGWRKGQVGSQLRKLGLTRQRRPRGAAEAGGAGRKAKRMKKFTMPGVRGTSARFVVPTCHHQRHVGMEHGSRSASCGLKGKRISEVLQFRGVSTNTSGGMKHHTWAWSGLPAWRMCA